VNSLSRVLGTSGLPAATIDKVWSILTFEIDSLLFTLGQMVDRKPGQLTSPCFQTRVLRRFSVGRVGTSGKGCVMLILLNFALI